MFPSKLNLTNKSKPIFHQNKPKPDRKVIMLLVDALREDFVEMGDTVPKYLKRSESIYQGRRIQLFEDYNNDLPDNTIFIPQQSEMPTVTSVRVKGLLTGALNAFFEISENFGGDQIKEDNVLYQLKQTYNQSTVVFAGDYIWLEMFGQYFDRSYPYPSFNVRDLDSLDVNTHRDMMNEIKSNNFTLLIGHIIGVDHAGHTYDASHKEIERKLNDTELIIQDIIDHMDNNTTLLVFGDHGMTDDGNHGGGSWNELKSILFTYSKKVFPMWDVFSQNRQSIKRFKQQDLATVLCSIFEISIPFQNLGVYHPYFHDQEQIDKMGNQSQDMVLLNLLQVQETKDLFQRYMILQNFLNFKYDEFRHQWASYDDFAIIQVDSYIGLILITIVVQKFNNFKLVRQISWEIMCIALCYKISYFYDKEKSMNFEIDPFLKSIKDLVQANETGTKILGIIAMIQILRGLKKQQNSIHKSMLGFLVGLGILLVLLMFSNEESYRNFYAKGIYFSSLLILVYLLIQDFANWNSKIGQKFRSLNYLMIVVFPLQVVNEPNQNILVLSLMVLQIISFKSILDKSLQFDLTHKNIQKQVDSLKVTQNSQNSSNDEIIQESKIQENTENISAQTLQEIMILPWFMASTNSKNDVQIIDKKKDEDDLKQLVEDKGQSKNENKEPKVSQKIEKNQYKLENSNLFKKTSLIFAILSILNLVLSGIMSGLTKKELMFPQRTAPKYVFDMAQASFYIVTAFIYHLVY
eukprot:403331920